MLSVYPLQPYSICCAKLPTTLDDQHPDERNSGDMGDIPEQMLMASLPQTESCNITTVNSAPKALNTNQYLVEAVNTSTNIKCCWRNCGLYFESLEILANHVLKSHANSGLSGMFYCEWEGCTRNKGFNARYKMLVHVRTHTNEKPHHCYLCSKSFSRAENLKIHKRSHNGEKPYICPVLGCNKAYSNSSDRFKHTKTHEVEKPYSCKVPGCSKRYTDPSSLRKHAKTYKHYVYNQLLEQTRTPVLKPESESIAVVGSSSETNFSNLQICSYPYIYPTNSCVTKSSGLLTLGALIDYSGANIEHVTWRKLFQPFAQHFKMDDNGYNELKNMELPLDLTVHRK